MTVAWPSPREYVVYTPGRGKQIVEAPATSSLRTLLAAELMTARRLGSTRFGLDRRQALLVLRRQDRQATLLWLVVE
jgi:hypothetical protein